MKKNLRWVFALSALSLASLSAEPCQKEELAKRELCNYPIRRNIERCEVGYFVNIGLIAEQMFITGTEVATVNSYKTETIDKVSQVVFEDRVYAPNFNLDVGLRVGLGYQTDHDHWTVGATFEWLSSTGRYSTTATGTELIFPYSVTSPYYTTTKIEFNSVTARLSVDYFLLDVALAKGVYFTNKFSYEPFAGIKAAWIYYNGTEIFGAVAEGDIAENTLFQRDNKVDTWGVGPMVGVNAFYELAGGWSIYASTNGSVLVGDFNMTNLIRLNPTATSGYQPERGIQSIIALCPTLRTTFGLEYASEAFNKYQSYFVRVGFDGRYYFNQYPNMWYRGVADTATNELDQNPFISNNAFGMLGLVAELGWYF